MNYTLTITDTGQTPYTGATVADGLAGVLDDAAYNGDASATAGTVSYASPVLTWTGSLSPGGSATVTFSVTVSNPDLGNKVLASAVTSAAAGSNCASGSTDPNCASTVTVESTALLTIAVASSVPSASAGGVVNYTVTVSNAAATSYSGAAFADSLSGVLDDAAYNGDASATAGTVSFASSTLTWTGTLAAHTTATVTFSVTVNNPDTGDKILSSTVTSASAGSNCASGSTDLRCASTVTVSSLLIVNSADVATTTPGSVIHLSVTFTNTGQTPYYGISIDSPGASVLANTVPDGDQSATSGTLAITPSAIVWSGDIPVGGSVTVTGSLTVDNPETGNGVITSGWETSAGGSNCPPGGTDSRCSSTVTVLTPGLSVVMAANAAAVVPGQQVGFTVTVTDTGQTPYSGAVVADSLAAGLNDAAYDGDAAASTGSVSYAAPVLTWTGSLAVGASAVISYTMTVDNPDTDGKVITATSTSAAAGSACPPGASAAPCSVTVPVLTPVLSIASTASVSTTAPGSTVGYTVTITDSGQTPYTGATVADGLAGVLDDAAYNHDASATAGTVSYASPVLTWTGSLSPGDSVTVTFSVTVSSPDTGDKVLSSTVTSAAAGSNCASGSTDPSCSATVTVSSLLIVNTADVATTTPGSVIHLSVTFTNTGQTPYYGISIDSPGASVLANTVPDGDQSATSGTLAITPSAIVWSGDIPVGGSVTVTGSLTVDNPETGNGVITSGWETSAGGSNCPPGGTDSRCSSTVTVLTPGLTITNTASTGVTTPGSTVGYTVTIADTGQTSYSGATVADDLSEVLTDAAYNGDAAATAGSVSFASPALTWTGSLAPGGSVTVTLSVAVDNPDNGNKDMVAVATSGAAGSTCPAGGTGAACRSQVVVLTPGLTISSTAGSGTAVPGGAVTYTVTITDSGQTPYTGATVADGLAGVLDDAAYNHDASATAGTVSYASPVLTWTGSLSPGDSVTVTFSVTVSSPDTGDKVLSSTVTSAAAGSNCASGSTDPSCSATVTVSSLLIVNTADVATTTPGSVIHLSVTFTNTGQTPYYGISIDSPGASVLANTVPDGDQSATSGTLAITPSAIVWSGDIPVGGSVTVTGSLTVDNPETGNGVITSGWETSAGGSNCPPGGTDPRCSSTVTVLTPGLTITNTASTSTPVPGSVVGYTLTIADTGQTSYSGVSVTDDLTGLLNDAAYNGDATATAGTVSYANPIVTWTGSLSPGGTTTVTFSATVDNPDAGDKLMVVTAASSAVGSTCPPGTTTAPCRNTIGVLTPGLTIASTASASTTAPGQTVNYTLTISDSGQTPYTGATVADSLAGVLDDAAYNGDAAATDGAVSFASPTLTWTGSLSPGGTATVTFSVTVSSPDAGNKLLSSTVTSAAAGNNCPSGSSDPSCATATPVSIMTITNTASTSTGTATPGSVVTYTVTVTNSGQADLTGAAFTVPLSDVLDDATYNGNAAATIGTVAFTSPALTWTGDLDTGQSAVITFTVTVNSPDTGNKTLADTITSATPGSTCPSSGAAPAACTADVTVLIPALTITKTASSSTTTPGSTVRYTITVADTGQTSYTGVTVTDDLTGVLNDAAYSGDASATTGTVSYASPTLTWTGDLTPGATATITYSVTVDNPDNGDKQMTDSVVSAAPGSTCPPGGTNPSCTTTVTDLIPALIITKTANVLGAAPGSAVDYTITVADTGQTAYTGAIVTDDLTGVLGAAAYDGDATATSGTVSYASPALTWTGDLTPGATATITYSVTIRNPETGGTSMTNTVTSAVPGSSCPSGASGGPCTVTTGVISGPLSITAPASAALGSGPPGSTISNSLGTIQVTDGRGFGADWSTSVSSSDFAVNGGGPAEIIPVTDATYAISGLTTATGPAHFGYVPSVGLTQTPQSVVSATSVDGNTSVTWNPVVRVEVPGGAVSGTYSAVIVHSVS